MTTNPNLLGAFNLSNKFAFALDKRKLGKVTLYQPEIK